MKRNPTAEVLLTLALFHVWYRPAQRYLIVHNIGAGTRMEDVLFAWKITGHYRYF